MSYYSIERIVDEHSTVGEGPHWDATTQALYFVDIVSGTINKYNPSTNKHTKATAGPSPSFIIPIEGTTDKFLISLRRDLAIITWDGISNTVSNTETIAEVDTDEGLVNNRLNDGKVDAAGRLWTGSMNASISELDINYPLTGRLYSYSNDQLKHHIENIGVSNGLAWSADSTKFYYIDSNKRTIDQFDYDIKKGLISNRKIIFSFEKHNIDGYPDGQTIDTEGNLWVAVFNDSKIIKIDPRVPETLLQTIDMPAKQVTSVVFGGKNLDELYVTTARVAFDAEAPKTPADGATYKISGLAVKGFAGVPFKLQHL